MATIICDRHYCCHLANMKETSDFTGVTKHCVRGTYARTVLEKKTNDVAQVFLLLPIQISDIMQHFYCRIL